MINLVLQSSSILNTSLKGCMSVQALCLFAFVGWRYAISSRAYLCYNT